MTQTRIWTAAIIVIGDEILSGRTQDRNIAQIAAWLNVQGIRLKEARVVGDTEQAIADAVNLMRAAHDYVFTTGGIGPTHDDITVDAIAAALCVPVIIHPGARDLLERYYADRGGLNEGRLRMARVPEGADLIANPVSGAPGIKVGNIFIMAGIPHITAGMLEGLTGTLEGGRPLVSVTVGAYAPESEVAELLRVVEKSEEGIAVGSYPFFKEGRVGSNFVIRSEDQALADKAAKQLADELNAAGFPSTIGGL
ncbi:MAG: molybdopterin-binding protein [Sphingomicrobium sp.]